MSRRAVPRLAPLVMRAVVDLGGIKQEGYLTNVSASGAFVVVDSLPPVGAEVSLRAILPWKLGELAARARVIWCSQSQPPIGAGLEFLELEGDSPTLLKAYLERFVGLAAQLDPES